MNANWTSPTTGNKYEMTANVIGKTAKDRIYTDISLKLNGEKLIVNGQRNEQGKNCLLVRQVDPRSKAFLVSIPALVYAEMNAELIAVQTAAANSIVVNLTQEAKDLADYLLEREMNNANSDF